MKKEFETSTYSFLNVETLAQIIALKKDSHLNDEELKERAETILGQAQDEALRYFIEKNGNLRLSEITETNTQFTSIVKELLISQAMAETTNAAKEKGLDLTSPPSGYRLN